MLQNGKHELVLSYYTICEVAAPLKVPHSKTNVMDFLNNLESLPHTFSNSGAGITRSELQAANAFYPNPTYEDINPFVQRFDHAICLEGNPSTKLFLNYSLAEIVWDLHCSGSLLGLSQYSERMKETMKTDRSLENPPSVCSAFLRTVEQDIQDLQLSIHPQEILSLGKWIYENPLRCPSLRLNFEMWHEIRKNKTDFLVDSDLEDYQHLSLLPYIDFMTLDKRMHAYTSQVLRRLNLNYGRRIFTSSEELIQNLTSDSHHVR